MTLEEYIDARGPFLERERKFRELVGVIIQRPENYCDYYKEIWPPGVQKIWDAKREYNLDEVPFNITLTGKQIVAADERRSLTRRNIKQYKGKYRNGTLVIISNCIGILLIVVIFPAGGSGVKRKLKQFMEGSIDSKVWWTCTESGNMTRSTWSETMNLFKNKTRIQRGCKDLSGRNGDKAVILDLDNYQVHLEKKLAMEYAIKYGIYIRCLLRNASQVQQPVDQHIGQTVKKYIKQELVKWWIEVDQIAEFGTVCLLYTSDAADE